MACSWIVWFHAGGSWMVLWPGCRPICMTTPSLPASVPPSRYLWQLATVFPHSLHHLHITASRLYPLHDSVEVSQFSDDTNVSPPFQLDVSLCRSPHSPCFPPWPCLLSCGSCSIALNRMFINKFLNISKLFIIFVPNSAYQYLTWICISW